MNSNDENNDDGYISMEEYDRDVMKRFGLGVVVALSGLAIAFLLWTISTFFK